MDLDEFEGILNQSLSDGRLSRGEKQALRARCAPLSGEQRALFRSRVFARARLEGDAQPPGLILDWVEAVLRCLEPAAATATKAHAYFSPGEDCRNALHTRIAGARQRLDICVFTITDNKIAAALQDAHERGVEVRIITDDRKAHDRGSDIEDLSYDGIEVREDRTPAHMHHKYAIVDGNWLINGSYNWTVSAWKANEENLVVSNNQDLLQQFQTAFDQLWRRLG